MTTNNIQQKDVLLQKEGLNSNLKTGAEIRSNEIIKEALEKTSGAKLNSNEVIVEKVFEKPVVVTHQEKTDFKETYEGKTIDQNKIPDRLETHVAKPIVKEIHQDVIHEHHKNVNIEHKKDVVHEHHQNVIHEHHQPVITEKHIHEHHQPIIHEKHQTLITEKNVPIVHEKHTAMTDKETKAPVVHEQMEKPVI